MSDETIYEQVERSREAFNYETGPRVTAHLRISPLGLSVGRVTRGAAAHTRRGAVQGFSCRSAARLTRYIGESAAEYRYFATFTLGSTWSTDGAKIKKRLDAFLKQFMVIQRDACPIAERSTQSAVWFLEFQARGAPHIHLFYTTFVPWQRAAQAWCSAMEAPEIYATCSKLEKFRGGRQARISYARKYAAKGAGSTAQELAKAMDGGQEKLDELMRGRITEKELYDWVVDNADRKGRKALQKVVPPGYTDVGRFWGIRGYKERVAASTTVPMEAGGDELLKAVGVVIRRARARVKDEEGVGYIRVLRWQYGDGVTVWGGGEAWEELVAGISLAVAKHTLLYAGGGSRALSD